ncbi:hypothetical protein AAV94_09155 [Lampropedia cohaerens]|uniref:Cyclic nucleotide-binding domain-containing protein n=1 Tax=Lampropedia cohaerens TaxID=1610491 RepID=A0A0U1PZ39_9BURK|nr:cyclic nucleotide-binding domain-containing protein [Lampropedia cohaerens]KKW67780.1 hypothetical protein AAV94_09155 [Lampropedia cohaerens]
MSEKLLGLALAFAHPIDPETPANALTDAQWAALAGYLVQIPLVEAEILFQRRRQERSLYFIETGRVHIHYENDKGAIRAALVSAGSLFGEASFLGNLPRQATAQVAAAGRAWQLSRLKFTELYTRQPDLALQIIQLAGTTLAQRARNARRRPAIA